MFIGIILTIIIVFTVFFYLLIRKCYTSKKYILEKFFDEQLIESTPIKGNYLDLSDANKNHMYIYREFDDQWYYTMNGEEKKEIQYNEPFTFENCTFKISFIEKKGGILFTSSLLVTLMTVLILSSQIYLGLNEGEKNANGVNDINKQPKSKPKKTSIPNKKEENIHSIVLKYENIFNNDLLINWENFKVKNRMRRSLVNHRSELGISVSEFNYTINWKKVKKDGIDYALIRLGSRGYQTGKLKVDEQFANNMNGAEENYVKKGIYFYSQAINKKEMDEEIAMILKSIKGYSLEYPIAISLKRYESSDKTRVHALSNEEYIDLIKYFCIRIKQKKHIPMIMGDEKWFGQFKDGTFDGYLKLVSSEKKAPTDIKNCIIWEYNEKAEGVVEGINTDVELSLSAYSNDEQKMK